jgi:translation initiation factor RLI1
MDKPNEQEIQQEEEGNDILNDDYLVQLHKYLQQMKEERIKAEKDTQFLDNRVNCLKNENEKTLKKIEVNRRKTQIREQARIRVNEARLQKGQFKEMKEKQLLEKKKQNQNMKQNNLQAILLKKEENSRKMEEDMKNFKEVKKNNEE